jgi:hypothetical protein
MKNIKIWKVILALVLVAGLSSFAGVQVASANNRSGADVIFTKWVTAEAPVSPVLANMAGVVSGDAGAGQFVGEVLEFINPPPAPTSTITALYHIKGGKHQFTARLEVTQDNTKGTAVLKGKVTDGWMKGARVSGSYQVIYPSGIKNSQTGGPFSDYCFQGTLHIQK